MEQRPRFLAILFLSALVPAGYAQQPRPATAKPQSVLLWKAPSPTPTVYMLVSIHVGDDKLYPLRASVESAFTAAKVLIVEVNAKAFDQAKTLELVGKYGMYSDDDTLSKHISKETADALDAYCSAHGLPRQTLEILKPWVVAATVIAPAMNQARQDPHLGTHTHFLNASTPPQRIPEPQPA